MRITKKLLVNIIAITILPVYGSQLVSRPNLNYTVTPATKRAAQENKDTLKKNTKSKPASRLTHTQRIIKRIKVLYAQATKYLWGIGTFKEHRVRRIVTGITGMLASIIAYYIVHTHLCPLLSYYTTPIKFPDNITDPVDQLIYAAHKGWVSQVQALLSSTVNSVDPNGVGSIQVHELGINTNALTAAATGCTPNHTKVVQLLINNKASLDGDNNTHTTPLHMASGYSNNPETVLALLNARANPNTKAEDDVTPLHLAVKQSQSDARKQIVFMLLKHSADPSMLTKRNQSPIGLAQERRPECTDILPMLEKKYKELRAE